MTRYSTLNFSFGEHIPFNYVFTTVIWSIALATKMSAITIYSAKVIYIAPHRNRIGLI